MGETAVNRRLGCWALCALLAVSSCASSGGPGDPLAAILAHETREALAAARIGPAGGKVAVSSGPYAGAALEVPAGALREDMVFSIYAVSSVTDVTGYRSLGPVARFWASAARFHADLITTLPFEGERVTASTESAAVAIRIDGDSIRPLAGAVHAGNSFRAPAKSLGDFGVVYDLARLPRIDTSGDGTSRCPDLPGGVSMFEAVNATRVHALLSMGSVSPKLLWARTKTPADGCGRSRGWEVAWYALSPPGQSLYERWPGVVTETSGATGLPCTGSPVEAVPAVDSTTLSVDVAQRWLSTPDALTISIRTCDDASPPPSPRIRFDIVGTSHFVEYTAAGAFVSQSF